MQRVALHQSAQLVKRLPAGNVGCSIDAGESTVARDAFETTVFEGNDEMAKGNRTRSIRPPLGNKSRIKDLIGAATA